MSDPATEAVFFETAQEFRDWLEANAATATELWVGFYRKSAGRKRITWPEAVDQALCFGWIDGVRRRIDDERYANRFTPRRRNSTWSAVNIERVRVLSEMGLMRPAGFEAFARRSDANSAIYTHEQRAELTLPDAFERELRSNEAAWAFWQAKPPSYRKAATWWILSAKKEETRQKRLQTLIADSARGQTIAPLTRRPRGT